MTSYRVVSQRDTVKPDDTGALVPVRVIKFVALPSDQPGEVSIPAAQFTADTANTVLSAAAQVINDVQALGEPAPE